MHPALIFLLSVLIEGVLAGAIYTLVALVFVVVYKSSRMINFAVGEWIMSGALLAGAGDYALGLGPAGGLVTAACGMAALGLAFNALVVRRVVAGPVISLIMVTLGLGALLRGVSALLFRGMPSGIAVLASAEPLFLGTIPVSPEKFAAAAIAAALTAIVASYYRFSRGGIALRAIADDPQAAAAAGIDVNRCFGLVWAATGVISMIAGVLWVLVTGGGFGVALVGLKVFPIVIIGGLDSIAGTIVAAMLIGVVESLGAGYLDPQLGGGAGAVTSYVMLLATLLVRPHGLFGRAPARRV